MSDYVQTHSVDMKFNDSDSWAILSEIEKSIKSKVDAVGTPLKDWDIQINFGIKTGFNDAFIIDSQTRDEILSKCTCEYERIRTTEIIRPILRGRDIRRYSYQWSNLWIINTHNGIKGELERVHIDDYPAIKQHIDRHWDKVVKRADQGDTPYNLRNCAYLDEFSKPKIIWKRVGSIIRFSYDTTGILGLDSTCFATGESIQYICCVLNSPMGHYLLNGAPRTGTGDLLISVQAVEPLRFPLISDNQKIIFQELLDKIILGKQLDNEINRLIFDLYGLSEEERVYIIENYA